jgi:hypothetical protein
MASSKWLLMAMATLVASHCLFTICTAEEVKEPNPNTTRDKIMSALKAMDTTAISGGTTGSDTRAAQTLAGQPKMTGGVRDYVARIFGNPNPAATKKAANQKNRGAMGTVRQVADPETPDGDGDSSDSSDFLPFCDPDNNVICANNDELVFLEQSADPIVFDGVPYVELNGGAGVGRLSRSKSKHQ